MASDDWVRIPSAHNGRIEMRLVDGRPEVFVDGFDQSTPYTSTMWHNALDRLPTGVPIARVLLLGLGTGTAVDAILARSPHAAITAVEWDPVMTNLFRRHHVRAHEVTIIEADAFDTIMTLQTGFDFIVIDLFKGDKTPALLAEDKTVHDIARLLTPDGICALNAFKSYDLLDIFSRHLHLVSEWRFEFNLLALYRVPDSPVRDSIAHSKVIHTSCIKRMSPCSATLTSLNAAYPHASASFA